MPPTVHDDIYAKAARDLADFTEPDLSDFTDDDIDTAMARAFTAAGARPSWLEWLRTAIQEASHGDVILEDADSDEFPAAVKGLDVSYQRLRGESGSGSGSVERTQLLTIGQFERPFRFVRGVREIRNSSSSLHDAVRESLRDIIDEALRRRTPTEPETPGN
ncbi:hypothetical protein [Streptomyces sp. RP5T]|uniref:hypothetical protein n=1 Tax=Streptomyces sp. RP5T TaxID=2490848 RepID=UPI000F64F4C3|nr:hypothetical protein [Streptomyces sp. RP5T]RRR74795.1 hypothetical protein EHS43_34700 [Streptomyces sp. RP5T]